MNIVLQIKYNNITFTRVESLTSFLLWSHLILTWEGKVWIQYEIHVLTPPHPSALARSFPVPSGSTPTAGLEPIRSSTLNTHPTVPSPPHANTRKLGTLRNISNLEYECILKMLNLKLSVECSCFSLYKFNTKAVILHFVFSSLFSIIKWTLSYLISRRLVITL